MQGAVEVQLLLGLADVRDRFAWRHVEVVPDHLGADGFQLAG